MSDMKLPSHLKFKGFKGRTRASKGLQGSLVSFSKFLSAFNGLDGFMSAIRASKRFKRLLQLPAHMVR